MSPYPPYPLCYEFYFFSLHSLALTFFFAFVVYGRMIALVSLLNKPTVPENGTHHTAAVEKSAAKKTPPFTGSCQLLPFWSKYCPNFYTVRAPAFTGLVLPTT